MVFNHVFQFARCPYSYVPALLKHKFKELRSVQVHTIQIITAFIHSIQEVRDTGYNIKICSHHCTLLSMVVIYYRNLLVVVFNALQIHPADYAVYQPVHLIIDRLERPGIQFFIIFLPADNYGFDLTTNFHYRNLVLEPAVLSVNGFFPFFDRTLILDTIDNRYIHILKGFGVPYGRRHA